MKRNNLICTISSVETLLLSIISCEMRDFKLMEKVKTIDITQIMATSAFSEGEIVDVAKSITDYRHYWSLSDK